jgi:hypothetical protein
VHLSLLSFKGFKAHHLALCPNCAAEFQYAYQTDEHKRMELILSMDSMAEETPPTKLRLVSSKVISARTLALIYQPDKQ